MKYLTEAAKQLLDDKLFDAISNFRLLKEEINIIKKMIQDKDSYVTSQQKIRDKRLEEFERTHVKLELHDDLPEKYQEEYEEVLAIYNNKIEKLPNFEKKLSIAFATLQYLFLLKSTGILKDDEIELLKNDTNNSFFDSLIALLGDAPFENKIYSLSAPRNVPLDQIDNEFDTQAAEKIKNCHSRKELCQAIVKIGLFRSKRCDQTYNAAQLTNLVDSLLKMNASYENKITSTYGLRNKAIELKNKRKATQESQDSIAKFRKGYFS